MSNADNTASTLKPASADKVVLNVNAVDMTPESMAALLDAHPIARFIHVDHQGIEPEGKNLIILAREHAFLKDMLVELANHGFMAYVERGSVTSFVHYNRIGTLWEKVTKGPCQVDENGLVYSLQKPLAGHAIRRILVVFSAMASKIYTTSLMRHFEQNFASVQKYLPVGTAVLRIADLGGVVGSYYMNTHALPDNEEAVQALLRRVPEQVGTAREDVVLYGVSKGGTAALYHGLVGGYRSVAVDPILADKHYIEAFNDSHFTTGVFPLDKKEKFEQLAASVDVDTMSPIAIVCSEKSPQFPYVTSVLGKKLNDHVAFFNSLHPDIKTHPDVGPKTINTAVMLMNMMFYKLPISLGEHVIDDVVLAE